MSLGQFMPDFDTDANFQAHFGVIGSICSCSWCFPELQRKVNYGQFEAVCQIFRKQFNALILRPLSHQHLTEQHSSCFIIFCILSLYLLYLSIYISRVWVLWLDRYVGWVSLSSICCIYLSKYLQYKDGDWTYMLDGSAYYLSVVSIYLYI